MTVLLKLCDGYPLFFLKGSYFQWIDPGVSVFIRHALPILIRMIMDLKETVAAHEGKLSRRVTET